MNKIIFLDIDGVLNSNKYYEECDKLEKDPILTTGLDIDEKCVENLKKIIKATNAKIVVSSSWRTIRKFELFKKYMEKQELPIYDVTPSLDGRGDEIRAWLEKNKEQVQDFILIDDDVFPDFNELIEKLIKTSFYKEGLEEKHVRQAIEMLGRTKQIDRDYER